MTASGTAGHGTELAGLHGPGRRSARSWSSRCRPSPGPATRRRACYPTAAGMINSVGLQGPGVAAWLARRPARPRSPPGRAVVVSIWGRTRRRVRGGRRRAGRRARPRSSRSRSTCRVPTSRTAARCSPTTRSTHGGGRRGHRRLSVGPGGPSSAPTSTDIVPEIAVAAAEAGAEAVTLTNTLLGHGDRHRDPSARARGGGGRSVGSGHPPDRGAGRLRRSTRRFPICRSSAWEGWRAARDAVELLLAGAVRGAGGHGDVRRSVGAAADPQDGVLEWCDGAWRRPTSQNLTGGAHVR